MRSGILSYILSLHHELYDKTNLHVLTRTALCMVNLTSSIKEDGTAKLITKNDISRLTSKLSVQRAANAEKSLQDGMQIVEALVRGTSLTDDDFVQCIGKLFVRVGLWCTNNMKKGQKERRGHWMKSKDYSVRRCLQ